MQVYLLLAAHCELDGTVSLPYRSIRCCDLVCDTRLTTFYSLLYGNHMKVNIEDLTCDCRSENSDGEMFVFCSIVVNVT